MEPNWKPLIERLGDERLCAGFMFMGRVNGINMYKHGIARTYLNLDDYGRCYLCRGEWRFEETDFARELTRLKAALSELGETLESLYDEEYIEKKKQALQRAGIREERIEIEPQDWSIN
ncbi:MAG: hypothetical protein WAN14_09740 [Candidatus Acidiferrales bacterium]